MTQATDDHLRRLPKVELHCHVEGAARASTIADLARTARRRPPGRGSGRSVRVHQPQPVPLDLRRHLRQLAHRRRLPPDHVRSARGRRGRRGALPRDVLLARVRHPPRRARRDGVGGRQGRGARRARQDLDINCRMILDFDKPTGPAHAMEMAAFAGSVPDRDLLIGMGADSVERGHRPRRVRRRVHRGGPLRAAPDDPRRRGRTVRQHRHRRPRARVRAHRPRLPAPRRRRADGRDRRAPDPARRVPDVERDDRQRRGVRRRAPLRPPARGGRAGDAELRRPRHDALRHRRRVRGRGAAPSATRSRTWRPSAWPGVDACWAPDDEKRALRRSLRRRLRPAARRVRPTARSNGTHDPIAEGIDR